MQEIDELEKKLSEAAQAKSALEEQMTALKSEMDQSKAAAEKQRLEAVADAEAAAEIRLQQVVVTQTRQEPERVQQQPQRTNADASAIAAEISRIVAEIDDLSQKIESPATDLAAQIRFNRERSELEAYVKGLRFSPSQDNTATS
jgi:chromosome segregation ATPase